MGTKKKDDKSNREERSRVVKKRERSKDILPRKEGRKE